MASIKFFKNRTDGKLVRPRGQGFPVGLSVKQVAVGNGIDGPTSLEYLIVGGGGAGGVGGGGGGGAGGLLTGSGFPVVVGTSYSVTVGAGGPFGYQTNDVPIQAGSNGSNSIFSTLTAYGGGRAAWGPLGPSGSGGSGGGGGGSGVYPGSPFISEARQGYDGASGYSGGGGGASANGSPSPNPGAGAGGAGGAGLQVSWASPSGSPAGYFSGGGGGGGNSIGSGGIGGGGNGGQYNQYNSQSGSPNTGGGGGGIGGGASQYNSGSGGKGIVIVRYSGSQGATGGTVTTSPGYTIHTFTGDGTFSVNAAATYQVN